jgi:hypothetical protein
MEKTKHTPGKLVLNYPKNVGSFEITVDGIASIASIHNAYNNLEEQEANAKRIVKCWNMHDELLGVCNNLITGYMLDCKLPNVKTIHNAQKTIKKATE